jgi:hypothetical protein
VTREEIDALPDTLTITLKKPITLGATTYEELTFSEPTAGQLEQISKLDTVKATIELLAHCAGVTSGVIRGLTSRQFKQADDFISTFMQDVQKTGADA